MSLTPTNCTRAIVTRRIAGALVAAVVLLAIAPQAAEAQGFTRVGPVGFGGYPAWYQDKSGLAMEFCSPLTQPELDGGWCLLLTGDTTAPETFPSPFFDEHFYWAGSADASTQMPNGGKALLVLALEGAFAVGPVIQGDQIVFGRVRIRVDPLPASGTYVVYTPFGKYTFPNQNAGDRLFFTEDIGIQCPPGDFTCALQSKVGFLLPSATPGSAEMPPVSAGNPNPGGLATPTPYPGTAKMYIADPARVGPATGSPLDPFLGSDGQLHNPNVFRVEGPDGFVAETANFSLMGRIFQGAMSGRVSVDRASYARTATAQKVDVFATGHPSRQARTPAGPTPAATLPQLQYYDAPCVANLDANGDVLSWSAPPGSATQMVGAGTSYWGQSQPAAIPAEVCVMQINAVDGSGQTVPAFFPAVLGDQVFITEALFDPQNQSLSVKATSSDQLTPPALTVVGFGDLVNGQYLTPSAAPLIGPPAKVRVTSSARGANEFQVSTGVGGTGPGATVPSAVNDSKTVAEDSGTSVIRVLDNDTVGGGPIPAGSIVSLTALPRLGSALVDVDGTIRYTPNLNANGLDSLTYTVAVNGLVSNVASVTVTITPVNDPPVAVNDSFSAVANAQVSLPVLANDLDVDGAADLVTAANLTQPVPSTAVAAVVGNAISFIATAAGTYTFTYKPRDAAGAVSANTATVTVIVGASETVTITLAEYRRNQGRLRITGTVSPATNPPQRLEIRWANGTNTVSVVATPVADAVGNWAIDIRGATGIQNPDGTGATQVRVTAPAGGNATRPIAFR
jgi:hypothetical protein